MATVRPLAALRYAPERVDLGLVLAPSGPVDEGTRAALEAREPRNIVRVLEALDVLDELAEEGEGRRSALVARRAALHLAEWRRAGVLAVDEHPALYLVRQTFDDADGEGTRVRLGFYGALELDGAAARDVRVLAPAEALEDARTAARVDAHRAHLSTCGVQTGAALFAYADESGRIERVLRAEMEEREPDLRGKAFGARYELWIVDDETTTARVARHLEEQTLTLASGRERYEATRRIARQMASGERAESARVRALGFFVKADASALDEAALVSALPPRGLVLAPLVAAGEDDG